MMKVRDKERESEKEEARNESESEGAFDNVEVSKGARTREHDRWEK